MYEFKKSSPEVLQENINEQFVKRYNFPWDVVPIEHSFFVGKTEVSSGGTLRTMASREGKRLGRVFRVLDDGQKYEVSYVRNRPEGPITAVKPGPKKEPKAKKVAEELPPEKPVTSAEDFALMQKRYAFDCFKCQAPNNDIGMMFADFEANETQVRMRCRSCGEYNVLDKNPTPKFFKD